MSNSQKRSFLNAPVSSECWVGLCLLLRKAWGRGPRWLGVHSSIST